MMLTLLTGREALERAESGAFQARWLSLHARCPWAGACQHPGFVAPWYRLYQQAYLPVLVLEEAADGALQGLLALALRPGGKTLAAAGDQQAEYQAWLAPGNAGDGFIAAAVRALRRAFAGVDLHLRYLPPGIPLAWIDEYRSQRSLVSLRSHLRPVMQVEEAAMARQRSKKNHRQNFNRLNRMGELRFERVHDHGQFLRRFDAMCLHYDFRQAALHHQMPFASDPLKKPFHIELHRRGLLHTTLLTVGDEVAASHFGLVSEGHALHIGIMTHHPAYAAHSPGLLLLAMLGVHLAQERTPMLDLTPGDDAYKELFATGHESVFELTIHANRRRRVQAEALLHIKRLSNRGLHKAGVQPANVLAALARLRHAGITGYVGALARRGRATPCSLRYRGSRGMPVGGGFPLARNRLEDIFKFDERASPTSQWEFMRKVMHLMERSHDLYTCVQDGKLVLACWVQGAAAPGAAIVLSDLYAHRELGSSTLLQAFIGQLLAELKHTRPHDAVHYRGALDAGMRAAVEQCGFVDDAS